MLPAGAAWIVTIVLLSFPAWMLPVAVAGWVLAAGFMALAFACSRGTPAPRAARLLIGLAVACAAVALVSGAAAAGAGGRRPPVLARERSISDATVVTTQTAVASSRFFAATLTRVDGESMSVPVLVFGGSPARRTEIGTVLRISGSLLATAPSDEVSYLVFARGSGDVVAKPPWYLQWAGSLRAGFAALATSLPGQGGELLPGLAIGDTVAVSPQLSSDMKTSSLSHLTAVSGANCAVVIGLILLVGRALGIRRGVRIALALLVLVGFVVLVTPQPSVMRSAIMATLVLGAQASGRPVAGLPIVGVTVLVMLALDPWIALDFGFALSVLATAGLMALTSPIAKRLEMFLPRWLSLLIAVPLAAQLACQPVLILLNPSLPLYGVLANSLAEPASPIATVLGLIACVALPMAAPVGHVLAAVAWVPSAWIASVASLFASLPGARLPWPGGFAGTVALAIATALGFAAAVMRLGCRPRAIMAASSALPVVGGLVVAALVPGIGVPAS